MRRLSSQASEWSRRTIMTSRRVYGRTLNSHSIRHHSDLQDSYAALSDFFRSNLRTVTTTTTTTDQLRSQQAAPSLGRLAWPRSSYRYSQQRSFASSSVYRKLQQDSKATAADHGQPGPDEHHDESKAKPGICEASTAATEYHTPSHEVIKHVSSFPRSLRELALSLPSASFRRPTKEECVLIPHCIFMHSVTSLITI
jgi:hypothetical protein